MTKVIGKIYSEKNIYRFTLSDVESHDGIFVQSAPTMDFEEHSTVQNLAHIYWSILTFGSKGNDLNTTSSN